MLINRVRCGWVAAGVALCVGLGPDASPAEESMWGFTSGRNLVTDATGIPTKWDPEAPKWVADLGSQTYAGPVVHGGKVFVGTNNQSRKNPKLDGDRGVIMAFDEADGSFLWQMTHTKLSAGRVNDWPQQGICSTPYIDGDRVYYVSNQCQVVCIDTEGFRDGENDGPFKDETETTEIDGDVIWSYDMIDELTVFPHNLATSSPVGAGDLLFLVTSNGVDEGHVAIPAPFAPSFIALNKNTGELVWESGLPGEHILHGQWGSPAYGVVDGKGQVYMPGGDGWIYTLDAETGKMVWKFDCNPKDSVWELGGRGTRNALIGTPVFYDNKVFIGVGQDPEHGEGGGHLWAIDATGKGDVTATHAVWHLGDEHYNRTISTVAIKDGLLYASDLSGFVYGVDLATGKGLWRYDTFAAIWGSPFAGDGKVLIGDEDGDVAVLKAGRKMELLFETNMGSAVYTTPVFANGVLYLATRNRLFAIEGGE